jgi:phosphohistidine swiveling domain-containing protein
VLENKWRNALNILRSATNPPLPLDLVEAVLMGRMTLVNEGEGLTVSAQDPKDAHCGSYLKTARWQKAGLLQDDGAFYQPYGVFRSFGKDDEEHVVRDLRAREELVSLTEYRKLRAQFHVHHPQSDRIEFDVYSTPVVFERVKDPAFWVQTFDEAKSAWEDFCKERKTSLRPLGSSFESSERTVGVDPRSWEFYMQGILEGVVYYSARDRDVLAEEELQTLLKAVKLRDAFEDKLGELDEEGEQFDEQGVSIDEASLYGQLRKDMFILMYTARVQQRANRCGGFLELEVKEWDRTCRVRVAAVPFLHWARTRSSGSRKSSLDGLPAWPPVFPSGAKMYGDDPMHTDWWASTGLSLQEAYSHDHPVNKAAWRFAYSEAVNTGASFVKLAGSGVVTGPVVFAQPGQSVPAGSIAVVSHAGVDYQEALMGACKDGKTGAVIAAVGGKLAHLAIVSREINGRLVVVDGALERFHEGQLLRLDLDALTLQSIEPEVL